jgi:trigger factor
VDIQHEGRPLRHFAELTVQLKPALRFQDAELAGFDQLLLGANRGDTRSAEMTVSTEAETIALRGETLQAHFTVKDVLQVELPELDKEFLQRLGVETVEELRDEIRQILERQVTYQQRQSARSQVLEQITNSANWELPENLVLRQVENALRREILEMQQAGFTTQQIRARENRLRQQAISTTRQALKEHFVLDKIATLEAVEVAPEDMEFEIRLMAAQRGESPRRVRARLQKSGMIENLEAQIRERKAVDIILSRARYEDVQQQPEVEEDVEAVPQSVCGTSFETVAGGPAEADDEEE